MTAVNAVVDLSIEAAVAVITLNSPPVNALSAPVRKGLTEAFKRAVADEGANAIVLICSGRTFIAGADISEFDGGDKVASIEDLQQTMELSPKPIVAAIHGTALGGGLEVALCAHFRIAVPSARCGLPEVNLGLLPGGGGTQRLPRAVGVEKALEMMTSGHHVSARECVEHGLLDAVVSEGDLRSEAIQFALSATARPLKRLRDNRAYAAAEVFADFRRRHAKQFRGFRAPESNIQCIEASVALPFEEGLKVEHELFMELVTGEQSAAQRYIFFAERNAAKIADLTAGAPVKLIREIWIAEGVTHAGHLWGKTAALVDSPAECDLAIFSRGTGREVSRKISALHPNAIVAGPDARSLSAYTNKPELVVGLLTNGTRLVEISRTDSTAPEAAAAVMRLARSAGNVAVVTSGEFVSEHMIAAQTAANDALVRSGVEQGRIESALYGFGFPGTDSVIQSRSAETRADGTADEEIVHKYIRPMIDEGTRLLQNKAVLRESDVDLVCTTGLGWPVYRGGPMYFARKFSLGAS
jgi:3-hydroxyacyl-CoA dehydrogenase